MDRVFSNEERDAIRKRLESSEPKLFSTSPGTVARQAAEEILSKMPQGYALAPKVATGGYFTGTFPEGGSPYYAGSGTTQFHVQRPFLPEFESGDRQHYPLNRRLANFYWRLYHKYDALFGMAMDMYSEMIFGDFDIVVKGDQSKEIKETLDLMCERVNLVEKLRYFVSEFLIIGEVFPHLFFDDDLGIWTWLAFHNPDYIDVRDAPMVNMDPIISYVPDDNLRKMLLSNTPESIELRERLPSEFVQRVMARQKIRLEPSNCSFIARKLHPYDIRGTSIASRLWQTFMIKDAVAASTIAVYRRMSSPIRVVKLGDPSTGYIPSPNQEAKLQDMLAKAETDPAAILVWSYAINFEAWGASDRAITIDKQFDTLEKMELQGLGLSKSFVSGETTFASARSGLQVFLRRLLSLRHFIESVWLYPKFFRPISDMNGWYRPSEAETSGKTTYRKRRTSASLEDDRRLIMPQIVWRNKLDPRVDADLLAAYGNLEKFGFKISKKSVASAVGVDDWKEEAKQHYSEYVEEQGIKGETLGETYKEQYDAQKPGAKPPLGGGAPLPGKPPAGAPKAPGGGPKMPPGEKTPPGGAAPNVTMNEGLEGPDTGMPEGLE